MQTTHSTRMQTTEDGNLKIHGEGSALLSVSPHEELVFADEAHQALSGSISDSTLAREALQDFYDAALAGTRKLGETLAGAHKATADLKEHVAKARVIDALVDDYDAIRATVDNVRKEALRREAFAQGALDAAMDVQNGKDATEILTQTLLMQEIRTMALRFDNGQRADLLNTAVDNNDFFTLEALSALPMPLLPMQPDAVKQAREHVALQRFPDIANMKENTEHIIHAVKVRTMEFMVEFKASLSRSGIKLDDIKKASQKRQKEELNASKKS